MSRVFGFPDVVNEVAARLVAGMVALLAVTIIGFDWPGLMVVLVYGFLARVAAGPRFSPMAQLALRVLVPLVGRPEKRIPGPPKRFAQAIGLAMSGTALVLYYGLGLPTAAYAILSILAAFATLEAALGFCAGCFVFDRLMRWGVIPQRVCEQCVRIRPSGSAVD